MEQVLLRWKDKERGLKLPSHTLLSVTHNSNNPVVRIDFHHKNWQSPINGTNWEDIGNPKLMEYTREEFENQFEIVEGSEMEIN